MKIAVSEFCQNRHDPKKSTRNTLFLKSAGEAPDWEWLLADIRNNWRYRKPGYRNGVVLVPVSTYFLNGAGEMIPAFTSPIVKLEEGDTLMGKYRARQEGEKPRKSYGVVRDTVAHASYVDVVLYSRDTLEEDPLYSPAEPGVQWEVVTILGRQEEGEPPMPPTTLMANHFVDSGGTSTNMTDSEFVDALRKSYEYWRDRAMVDVTV